ncbi:hypothetical protein T261_7532 [Streptomyces lydicus]|nr:hypothetical protein T261_7532 [Streptomyces lydicus]
MPSTVRRLLAGDPESDYYVRLLDANVPHPHRTLMYGERPAF